MNNGLGLWLRPTTFYRTYGFRQPNNGIREITFDVGRPISRERAADLGFKVSPLEEDQTFQDLVLSAFHATIHTHNSLGVVKLIENQHGNRFLIQERFEESDDETNPDSDGDNPS